MITYYKLDPYLQWLLRKIKHFLFNLYKKICYLMFKLFLYLNKDVQWVSIMYKENKKEYILP